MLHIRFMAFIQFLFCWMQLIMFFQFPYIGWGKKKSKPLETQTRVWTALTAQHYVYSSTLLYMRREKQLSEWI
jgi:hypothetical protein